MRGSGATGQSTDTFSPTTAGIAGTMGGRGCVSDPVHGWHRTGRCGLVSWQAYPGRAALDDVLVRCSARGVRGVRCEWRVPSPSG